MIVKQVIFTLFVTDAGTPLVEAASLENVAVLPRYQQWGIGSQLLSTGIDGPGYYPRLGFAPAQAFGTTCEFDVPLEVFMVLELESMRFTTGRVVYAMNRSSKRYEPDTWIDTDTWSDCRFQATCPWA